MQDGGKRTTPLFFYTTHPLLSLHVRRGRCSSPGKGHMKRAIEEGGPVANGVKVHRAEQWDGAAEHYDDEVRLL